MKTMVSELHLVIDVSGSMRQEVEEGGGGKTRLMCMQSVATHALQRWTGPGRVAAYACCGTMRKIGDGIEAARKGIAALGEAVIGGDTKRWDCLGQLLESLKHRHESDGLASAHVILLTDTDVDTSDSTWDTVEQRFDEAGVELAVLAYCPKERESALEAGGKVRVVRLYAEMDDEAQKTVAEADAAAFHPLPERRGRVIVAFADRVGLRERVEQLHDMAVDYLSGLLGASYRPVPTVVIEDSPLLLQVRRPVFESPDPVLAADLDEMLSLLNGGCLTVHKALWSIKNSSMPARPQMSDGLLDGVRTNTEFQMQVLLRALLEPSKARQMWDEGWTRNWKAPCYRIPGVFGPDVPLLDAQVNLLDRTRAVLSWMARRPTLSRSILDYCGCYFEERRLSGSHRGPYRQKVWERHLQPHEYDRFAACFDSRGMLTMEIEPLGEAFGLTFEAVQRLLKQIGRVRGRAMVKEMRALGVFIPKGSGSEETARKILVAAGIAGLPTDDGSGLVFLCHERCVALMEQLVPDWPEPSERLLNRILFSVILHEHMHGAMWRCFPAVAARDPAVEESLAEWVEIDACRGGKEEHRRLIGWVANEKFQQVVLDHAADGPFPEWPYQGAALIEEMERRNENRGEIFKQVLDRHTGAESAKAKELLMRRAEERP